MDFSLIIKKSELKTIEDAMAYLANPVPAKLPLHLEHLSEDKWQSILVLFHQLQDEQMDATIH
tara:strand:- start:43 stop:231 length:189 start_codon:yes stop_codon:yes gene_type:complete